MPLTDDDIKALAPALDRLAMPLKFRGDRVESMQLGVAMTIEVLKGLVSLDAPKKEDGK